MALVNSAAEVFSLQVKEQNSAFDSKDNIVLLTFDDNYVEQSINLILSIAHQHPAGVSYVCICPTLKPENMKLLIELKQGIQVLCYQYTPAVDTGRWAACAVFRLFCPWLLDENIHRVLYMDSDILCTGDLTDIFQLDVPCIAMCSEISGNVSEAQQHTFRKTYPTQVYCNSGVVVFNLDYLRQNHTFPEIYSALCEMSGKFVYLDQDFLNVFFMGRITQANPFHYNFQAYELRRTRLYKKALRHCRLVHFSVGKPWSYKADMPLIRLYLKHTYYPPMIKRVKKAATLRLLYAPYANARRLASNLKYAFRELPD